MAAAAKNGSWDLATAGGPSFWIYAVNPSPYGFQVNSPWVRLATDTSNYADYNPSTDLLGTLNQWVWVSIPLAGDATWQRTVTGSPNHSNINWIEIHADTWDAGFTLWLDDFGFTTPMVLLQGLTAVAGNASVALTWQKFNDVTGNFNHYAVYRDLRIHLDGREDPPGHDRQYQHARLHGQHRPQRHQLLLRRDGRVHRRRRDHPGSIRRA